MCGRNECGACSAYWQGLCYRLSRDIKNWPFKSRKRKPIEMRWMFVSPYTRLGECSFDGNRNEKLLVWWGIWRLWRTMSNGWWSLTTGLLTFYIDLTAWKILENDQKHGKYISKIHSDSPSPAQILHIRRVRQLSNERVEIQLNGEFIHVLHNNSSDTINIVKNERSP